jgi:hypothetical protein
VSYKPEVNLNASIISPLFKIFEHRLDNYWKDQDLLCNYESNLTTGEEIEIDEEKELSIVEKSSFLCLCWIYAGITLYYDL